MFTQKRRLTSIITIGILAIMFLVLSSSSVYAGSSSGDPGIDLANQAVQSANQALHNLPTADTSPALPEGKSLYRESHCSNYGIYYFSYGKNVILTRNNNTVVVMRWDGRGNIATPGVHVWINGVYQGHYLIPLSVYNFSISTHGQYVYEFWIDRWENHWESKPIIKVCPDWNVRTAS